MKKIIGIGLLILMASCTSIFSPDQKIIMRGVDVVTIAAILGHARPSTTLIYSHTSRERKRMAVEKLS